MRTTILFTVAALVGCDIYKDLPPAQPATADGCRSVRNMDGDGVILVCDGGNPVEISDGVDGADGAAGPQGTSGTDGRPGLAGTPGEDGEDGRDGRDGLPGQPGANGQNGSNGADGPDGAQGPQGPAGADGQPGRDGNDGEDGEDGQGGADGANCYDFLDNDQNGDVVLDSWDCVWAAICPAPANQVGDVNNDGVVDLDDCRELLRGPQGPAGAQGPQGPAGANGADGQDGADGADGQDGADGNDGAQGPPGPAGRDGRDGQDGCGWECPLLGGLRCNAGIPQECRQNGDPDVCGEWVNKPACSQGQICNNGQCQAVPPEICNGLDDDGDGLVDEEPTSEEGGECSVFCLVGDTVCDDSQLECSIRVPPQPNPQQEVCDGIDNDCDGQTDEAQPDLDGDRICDALDNDVDGDTVNNPQDACPREFGDPALNGCPCNAQRACPGGRVCNARGLCDAAPPPPPVCNPACGNGQVCVNGACVVPQCNPACPQGQICGVGNVCHVDGIAIDYQLPAGATSPQISYAGYWGTQFLRGAGDGRDGRMLCAPLDQDGDADGDCWRDLCVLRDANGVSRLRCEVPVPRGHTFEFQVTAESGPYHACTGNGVVTGTFNQTSSPENAALVRSVADNRLGGCNFRVTRP